MEPFFLLQRLAQEACGRNDADLRSLCITLGLTNPTITADTVGGQPVRRVETGIPLPQAGFIPIGNWKLRLGTVPAPGGGRHVPVSLLCNSDGSFRELRITLTRFDLEADPNQLAAANFLLTPHIHLEEMPPDANGDPIPVHLIAPGMILILRGAELDDFSLQVTGPDPDSPDRNFPSARFEPPHFIVKGAGVPLGIACDEVLLDLLFDQNPTALVERFPETPPSFRGILLKKLGVYIGDSSQVGTWGGTASVENFVMNLAGQDISGLFIGELVHFVLESDPQVQVKIFFVDAQNQVELAADQGDALIPAPPQGKNSGRVRLIAQPNWASAGYQIRWLIPTGVSLDETNRRNQLDLGWVSIPADGQPYEFTVEIEDHRLRDPGNPDPATNHTFRIRRRVIVAERLVNVGAPAELGAIFDAILEEAGFSQGQRPTNRLHVILPPNGRLLLNARISGTAGTARATLTLPPGFSLLNGANPQTVNHAGNTLVFPDIQWQVQAPSASAAGVFVLDVSSNQPNPPPLTLQRRLRVSVEDHGAEASIFEIFNMNDWLSQPGIGLIFQRLKSGLELNQIEWQLDNRPIDSTIFSDPAGDSHFSLSDLQSTLAAPDSGGWTSETIQVSDSGGTLRVFLPEDDRLWRLSGRLPAGPPPAQPFPLVVGETGTSALTDEVVKTFVGGAVIVEKFEPGKTILFRFNCAEIVPVGGCTAPGTEHPTLRTDPDQTDTAQAVGFAALYRAIEENLDRVVEIGLFGAASLEGTESFNLDLSNRRVNAVASALPAPTPALRALMSSAAGYTVPDSVLNRLQALNGAGKIIPKAFGEAHGRTVMVNGQASVDPRDRRVFAVLKLAPPAPTQEILRREYFITLLGAPPPSETLAPPAPVLEKHPFRHSFFRLAHVEMELLHSDLLRFQLRLKLDLEKFNENDELPGGDLNTLDGLITFFLELRLNPANDPALPDYSWEGAFLSDPGDIDGIALLKRPDQAGTLDILGPPAVVLPPLTALLGGQIGLQALVGSLAAGYLLATPGLLEPGIRPLQVEQFIWRGMRMKLVNDTDDKYTLEAAVDYSVKYNLNVDLNDLGLPFALVTDPAHPIEISFRNVGMRVNFDPFFEFFYNPDDGFQLDVNDPGVFRLGDGLGRLLNVDRFRAGAGSPLWFEVELSLNLESGIFAIDKLRIRVSLEVDELLAQTDGPITLGQSSIQDFDLSFSLNKLGVSANLPGILEGSGEFGFSQDSIEGALDIEIVPLDLRLAASLAVFDQADFRALYADLGIQFTPGLPLFSTGLAIYGFFGLVGSNMARRNPDPLPWFTANPVGVTGLAKWRPQRGAWAFGVGAVLGTTFDDGTTFNTKGAFVLELPGPRFLLGSESRFIKDRPAVNSSERGDLLSVILLDLENDLLLIGMDFTFNRPPLIKFRVPVEASFNLADASDWRIYFGQWEPVEKRISLKLLNLWDAWGYLDLDGRGERIPGPLDLHGISLATGARIEVLYGSRSAGLYLEAFAEFHAGVQIDPFLVQGLLKVGGSLHLFVASIGASGKLEFIAPNPFKIKGEVCGELDLWLTSVKKCIPFKIGDGNAKLPDPISPFQKMAVIDRMTSQEIQAGERAPLDAVIHLAFNQDLIDLRVPPGISLSGPLRNQVSDNLYYEYYLESVKIIRQSDGATLTFQSAWAPYTLSGAQPQQADSARTLRLLDWLPHSHPYLVDFQSGYGETLRNLILRLCKVKPPPEELCATFDEERLGIQPAWTLDEEALKPVVVISSFGDALGGEGTQQPDGSSTPRVVLRPPINYPGRQAQKHSLRLSAPPFHSQRPKLVELLDLIPLALEPPGVAFEKFGQFGILLLRLPDLVEADCFLITGKKLPADGEAVFLDARFAPLSPVIRLSDLPVLVSGTGGVADLAVRSLPFGPPQDADQPAPAAWLAILSPSVTRKGTQRSDFVYLDQVCGITLGAWQAWRNGELSRLTVIEDLLRQAGLVGGVPFGSTFELLERNTTYRVEAELSWARFHSPTGATPDGTGTLPLIQSTFRTTNVFPQEIRRYIAGHNPTGDQEPLYYREPLEITFASDVVDRLFAKFNRQLVVRAKADTGQHALNQPMSQGSEVQFFPVGDLETTLLDILTEASTDCLNAAWDVLFPKQVYTNAQPLTKNTGYTISLLPRPLSEPGGLELEEWNLLLENAFQAGEAVYRFDIRTSRYGDFAEHIAAYRSAAVLDLFAEDEAALDTVLSNFADGRSDAAAQACCVAMTGGPMAIPSAPQVTRLWVPDSPGGAQFGSPNYRCRGLLLDGPEALLKRRPDGSERVQLLVRRKNNPNPLSFGQPLAQTRLIFGEIGARLFIFFKPNQPPPLVQVTLRSQPKAGGNTQAQMILIPVGSAPAAFIEEGG